MILVLTSLLLSISSFFLPFIELTSSLLSRQVLSQLHGFGIFKEHGCTFQIGSSLEVHVLLNLSGARISRKCISRSRNPEHGLMMRRTEVSRIEIIFLGLSLLSTLKLPSSICTMGCLFVGSHVSDFLAGFGWLFLLRLGELGMAENVCLIFMGHWIIVVPDAHGMVWISLLVGMALKVGGSCLRRSS